MVWVEEIIKASWYVLVASAPYILLGFMLAGLLKAFLPDTLVARHLGSRRFSGVVKACLLGIPLPLCSCGVLPTAAGLREQGAGRGETSSFLIATPETGADSIAVTWALLDPFMAVIRPFSAFITALFTGGIIQLVDRWKEGRVESLHKEAVSVAGQMEGIPQGELCRSACCKPEAVTLSVASRLKMGMVFAFGDLFGDIAIWFFFGLLIAGAISVFVTPDMVSTWLGNPLLAMLAMLAVSVPLYVCATASTPIAAALVMKGLNPGAALVFLLAGPAINAASFTVISRILGRSVAMVHVGGIVVCAFVMGMAADWFYALTGGVQGWHGAAEEDSGLFGLAAALILLILFVWNLGARQWQQWRGGRSSCSCEGHCHG
ncbi:SO_0444 family Cu/Zn efflux transporter [Desulfobotulus sp. H1]|uniref:SO_0444 family Cu/Zn efflux transporter n=1 Tax=Desulfobotulus pelophilus TaxID=2823377 RepID=A0ABT3NBR8_9BACT|nr:SO_0444 family Cu/Zn efflux transporter [Desulfobotulus pelophilus]MCW7754911.1 SO_0444 family Cu/Zn efflux transporter [Desulfobotulus pelophilus]